MTNIGANPFRSLSDIQIHLSPELPTLEIVNGFLIDKVNQKLICCVDCQQEHFEIPRGIKTIGEYAFCGVEEEYEITIPKGVTSIGCYAFKDSTAVSITVPDGVTCIGAGAFAGYTGTIKLPDSITTIESNPFAGYMCINDNY